MHICVISPDFPTSKTIDFIFVDQLCRALVLCGEIVTVIAPQTLSKCLIRNIPVAKGKSKIYVSDNKYYTLIRPKYVSVGNLKGLVKDHNGKAFCKAVAKGFIKIDEKVDVLYGHFWQSVLAALPIAKDNDIPLIASSGEEFVNKERIAFTDEQIKQVRECLSGAIHVSSNNKDECIATGLVNEVKSVVIPNAINNLLFYPRNKENVRRQIGVAKEDFVIAFVGQFVYRKGTLRVDEALKLLNDDSIKAIFIGKGADHATYKNIIVNGPIAHDNLPDYLTAADVFVLPTLQEGCCNAIIEAMACGLPIISSNLPFNYDVLDESNSILIDPLNISHIADAIKKIKDNDSLRMHLSQGSFKKAEGLTLNNRAQRIVDFITQQIKR